MCIPSKTIAFAMAVTAIGIIVTAPWSANAEPLPSCASKFIGSWEWTSATGIYTHHEFSAGGYANCSGNSYCTRNEFWSCRGRQFIYNNGMGETVLTLSADGRKMTGMGGIPSNLQTLVRVGAAQQENTDQPEGYVGKAKRRIRQGINKFAKAGLRFTKKLGEYDHPSGGNNDECLKQTYPYAGNAAMCEMGKKTDNIFSGD